MGFIYICPKCGLVYKNGYEGHICTDCKELTVNSGYSEEEWYALPRQKRDEIKSAGKRQEIEKAKQEIEKSKNVEQGKQNYANSFKEFYEYDVVTIVNENHGQVDKQKMMQILADHAMRGWRLHSVYSNELGKNALRILGFGVNATACEDVLIFERRVESLS